MQVVGIHEPHGDLCVLQRLTTLACVLSDIVSPNVCTVMRIGPDFAMGHFHVLAGVHAHRVALV